jgi:hypothetical protein
MMQGLNQSINQVNESIKRWCRDEEFHQSPKACISNLLFIIIIIIIIIIIKDA